MKYNNGTVDRQLLYKECLNMNIKCLTQEQLASSDPVIAPFYDVINHPFNTFSGYTAHSFG